MKFTIAKRLVEEKGINPLAAEAIAESMINKSKNTKEGKEKIENLQKQFNALIKPKDDNK